MSIRRMNEGFDRKFQEYNLNEETEKFVVYTQMGDYYVTPKSNYGGMIQNSRKVHHMKDFTSAREVIDYWNKYFHTTDDDFEVIDEGYELLSGTKVKCFRDYYKAKKVAEEAGLKESEYGDAYGISYCCWNTSGDRNEDEEVVAWYAFDGRKPRPLTDEEAEKYERKLEVKFDDFDIDESCKKESLSTDLGEYQKWVDYDMERYGHISAVTHKKIKDAGLSVVKDQYGQYEVIADRPVHESVIVKKSKLQERNLTKAERHNRDMDRAFRDYDARNERMAKFLKDHGVSDDEIAELKNNTGLGRNALDDKMSELGIRKDFFDIEDANSRAERERDEAEAKQKEMIKNLKWAYGFTTKEAKDWIKSHGEEEANKAINKSLHPDVKESLSHSERREFISKMTKALMDDKFGYSREEANDIAIKRADALGDDWRVRWGGDIDKEIKQELERTVSKVGYQAIYGKMADESLKEGHIWGDTTIEDYIEKNFSGDDESKQKLIDWFVSLDYTNQFGFKDISVKDIFKKANEFGLSRKYSAVESINESQSQEIAYYYRQLKDKNGFDVARLADAFYKTPEWKEIDFQGDVLFTEKGWNAFKKWAKETKNVDIKDLGSSDDFLGEGRLTEKKWRYTLKNGRALRDAIETEDYIAILATIQLCYQELNDAGIIDDDDCEEWVEEIDYLNVDEMDDDDIDYWLDQLYDVCDNLDVWIPLNEEKCDEDTVKQGNYWVNKGKEGTHGKFKTKKEADAQRAAMYARGFEG